MGVNRTVGVAMSENCVMEVCSSVTADDSGFSSPGFCYESSGGNCSPENVSVKSESGRRGRPKAAMITNLMKEGAVSQSGIRCDICSRVFPRDKSLQAHLRVHTGERPYSCDYPGCVRKFKQSGQLKTHQRLHTGERPFLCSASGCSNRFTHANRHCSSHPGAPLVRSDDFIPYNPDTAQSEQVRLWLIRYMTEKRELRSEKKCKQRDDDSSSDRRSSDDTAVSELSDISNLQHSTVASELSDMTNLQHNSILDSSAGSSTTVAHHQQVSSPLRSGHRTPLHEMLRSPVRGQRTPLHEMLRSPVRGQRTPLHEMLRSPNRIGRGHRSTPLHELLRSPVTSGDFYSPTSVPCLRIPPYSSNRYDDVDCSETEDMVGVAWSTPLPSCRPAVKNLFADSPSPMLLSPRKRELPKKRWLRIARREEESSANSRRPTVLRYLAATESYRQLSTDSTPCHESTLYCSTTGQTECTPLSGSPLLSRLLTMPSVLPYEEDFTPLAVPLPHD